MFLLQGQSPKGVPKAAPQDLDDLQLCGIISTDYNIQRLPGAKFFKRLPQLVSLIAAGGSYTPVTKQDIGKGFPTPCWNEVPQHNTSSKNKASPAARPPLPPAAAALKKKMQAQPGSSRGDTFINSNNSNHNAPVPYSTDQAASTQAPSRARPAAPGSLRRSSNDLYSTPPVAPPAPTAASGAAAAADGLFKQMREQQDDKQPSTSGSQASFAGRLLHRLDNVTGEWVPVKPQAPAGKLPICAVLMVVAACQVSHACNTSRWLELTRGQQFNGDQYQALVLSTTCPFRCMPLTPTE